MKCESEGENVPAGRGTRVTDLLGPIGDADEGTLISWCQLASRRWQETHWSGQIQSKWCKRRRCVKVAFFNNECGYCAFLNNDCKIYAIGDKKCDYLALVNKNCRFVHLLLANADYTHFFLANAVLCISY
jgi:hypothetical protein